MVIEHHKDSVFNDTSCPPSCLPLHTNIDNQYIYFIWYRFDMCVFFILQTMALKTVLLLTALSVTIVSAASPPFVSNALHKILFKNKNLLGPAAHAVWTRMVKKTVVPTKNSRYKKKTKIVLWKKMHHGGISFKF